MERKRSGSPGPTPNEQDASESLLEAMVDAHGTSVPPMALGPSPVVGECIDARHPTLIGRVRVRFALNGQTAERWVPTMQGMAVREGDRVLLSQPVNWPEPVVMGVLDGFAKRPEVAHATGARLELKADEAVKVTASDGTELLEVYQSSSGPVVKLLRADVDLELPGKLKVSAESIELAAREGGVKIKANDDVVVEGETISLN